MVIVGWLPDTTRHAATSAGPCLADTFVELQGYANRVGWPWPPVGILPAFFGLVQQARGMWDRSGRSEVAVWMIALQPKRLLPLPSAAFDSVRDAAPCLRIQPTAVRSTRGTHRGLWADWGG